MTTRILDYLYLGSLEDSKRFGFPMVPIQGTLDLTGWWVEKEIEEENFTTILEAIEMIDWYLSKKHPILVHCVAAVDRSPFIVACYLYTKYKRPGYDENDAYDYVKEKHPWTFIHDDWMRKFVGFLELD